MLSAFDLIAILLVLTALFGWINHRFIRLPHTVGLLVMGLGASLFLTPGIAALGPAVVERNGADGTREMVMALTCFPSRLR